ncbi:MAG: hypothetical protein R2852_05115 [Bacteroidia bacterium]
MAVFSSVGERPLIEGFSLSRYQFSSVVLPAISENFKTNTRSEIIISNKIYQAFENYESFKLEFLKNLKGELEPVVWHSLDGDNGNTAYTICPFKEEGGRYYYLKSYKIDIKEGQAFSLGSTVNSKRAVNQSVLSTGKWYKFSVVKDGVIN